jgi:hypothetical protein
MRRFLPTSALLLLLPQVASAAAARTFSELANQLVVIMDSAAAVLIVIGLAIYLFGVATGLNKDANKLAETRTYLVWGVAALFLMVSIWGILQLLQNTLFGGNASVSSPSSGGIQQSTNPFGP